MDIARTSASSSTGNSSDFKSDFGSSTSDSHKKYRENEPAVPFECVGKTNITRGLTGLHKNSSSDSENSSSCDDSDGEQNRTQSKPAKRFYQPGVTDPSILLDRSSASNKAFADASQLLQNQSLRQPAKLPINKFNIWSNVLAEQGLVQDLNLVGVKRDGLTYERDCESYDYTAKYRLHGSDPHDIHRRLGLKRSSTDRCSSQLPLLDKNKRSFTVSEDDTEEKVVMGIATILREPKMDLIGRVVSTLGTKKSVELLRMTEDIEEAGGLMTLDNSRRRTPGGVFLQLVRTDNYISKMEKDVIFEVERAEYVKAKRQCIKAKKRQAKQKKAKDKEMEVTDDLLVPTLPTLGELIAKNSVTQQLTTIINPENMESSSSEKEPGELDSESDSTD